MSDPRQPVQGEEIDLGNEEAEEIQDADDGEGDAPDADDGVEDEAGDDAEEEEGDGVLAETRAPRTRGQNRVQRLANENRDLRSRLDQLSGQVSVLQRPAQPAIDPMAQARMEQAEMERVQQMLPHEVAAYYANKATQSVQSQVAQLRYETADAIDRTQFETRAERSPSRQRLAQRVEQVLTGMRQQGQNTTRENIYRYLLGDEVDRKASQGASRQRQNGQRRVIAQTTRPGNTRGDVARAGRPRAGDGSEESDIALLRSVRVRDA